MGKRGPRPTPTAVLEQRGSDLPTRRATAGKIEAQPLDVVPVSTFPRVPTLDQCRAVVAQAIQDIGSGIVGGEIAQEMLACALRERQVAANRLAQYRKQYRFANHDENTIKVEKALAAISATANDQLLKLIREHGLSPASVSEIKKPPPKQVIDDDAPEPLERGL